MKKYLIAILLMSSGISFFIPHWTSFLVKNTGAMFGAVMATTIIFQGMSSFFIGRIKKQRMGDVAVMGLSVFCISTLAAVASNHLSLPWILSDSGQG